MKGRSEQKAHKDLLKINETRRPKIGDNVACKIIPLDDVDGDVFGLVEV